jgi:hypothetical protein
MKGANLVCGRLLPLLWAVGAVALGSLGPVVPAAAEGMLSAGNPILVDDDGDGPDNGDRRFYALPCYRPGTHNNEDYCLTHPWQSCYDTGGLRGQFEGSSDGVVADPNIVDGFGRSTATSYQSAVVGEVDRHGRPSQWQMVSATFGKPTKEGKLEMIDANNDARYEYLRIEEIAGNPDFPTMLLGLVGADTNNDNFPDYASVEWSVQNATTWGIRDCPQEGVGPADPIWVPVGRDAQGDAAVILDLNDDGAPDPQFLLGPKLALGAPVVPIPTLGEWALLALGGLLAGAGVRRARQAG